jgi:hypothetical protein
MHDCPSPCSEPSSPPAYIRLFLVIPHIHNRPDTVPRLHDLKGLIDLCQRLAMRDELVHLELAGQVVLDQIRQLRAALDAAESAALPYAARNQLECYRCLVSAIILWQIHIRGCGCDLRLVWIS